MSFYEWFVVTKGYYKKLLREEKLMWKQTSMLMYASLIPHQKKGSKLTPQSVLPYAWDDLVENEDEGIVTAEDIENVKQFWEEKDKKKKRGQSNN